MEYSKSHKMLINAMHQSGMCDKSIEAFSRCKSLQELVNTLDFWCYELVHTDFLSSELLLKLFTREDLRKEGIYIDEDITIDGYIKRVYLFGKSHLNYTAKETRTSLVFVSEDSFADVKATGYSIINILKIKNGDYKVEKLDHSVILYPMRTRQLTKQ